MTEDLNLDIPELPCYLNGRFTTLRHAQVSVLDRGFIFGDGVYEVLPVYAGQVFRLQEHLARLGRSLAETRIDNPLTSPQWLAVAEHLIAEHAKITGAQSQLIYIQVTRGVAMRDHPMTPGITPTVFMMCNAMKLPSAVQLAQGVKCVTADDFRWLKANIKSTSLLGAVFARQISVDQEALETIMFRDGFLSEAAASNVWVVKGGQVIAPPKDNLLLEGIRYGLIEEICRSVGVPFALRRIAQQEVFEADELMLSSASKEILPVTLLDGCTIGTGLPGPVFATLHAAYQQAKQASRH